MLANPTQSTPGSSRDREAVRTLPFLHQVDPLIRVVQGLALKETWTRGKRPRTCGETSQTGCQPPCRFPFQAAARVAREPCRGRGSRAPATRQPYDRQRWSQSADLPVAFEARQGDGAGERGDLGGGRYAGRMHFIQGEVVGIQITCVYPVSSPCLGY